MSSTSVERELTVQNYDDGDDLKEALTWGLSYRTLKDDDKPRPINPKHSPVNVPFKLCRAFQKTQKSKKVCKCHFTHTFRTAPHLSLMDRSVLNQDEYMELLSTPNKSEVDKKRAHKKTKPKPCDKCKLEPCPPRLIKMAVPRKRCVLETWKVYQHSLPTETLMRLDQILKSGNNLEPRDARNYFKKLKMEENKKAKKRKKVCRKRKEDDKRGDKMWLKIESLELVDAIVRFIKNQPLFMLNFQQMVTSDELIRYLGTQKVVKVKSRNTNNVYHRAIIEVSDKLVKWMDTMSFFADIQPMDSKEKVAGMPSLEGMLEDEEEGEESSEGEEGVPALGEVEGDDSQDEEPAAGGDAAREEFLAEKILDKALLFGEDEGSVYDMLRDLDEDTLEKLIQILSESPDSLLAEEIETTNLPGVTYADVLQKLREIRDGNLLEKQRDKIFLEERMIEWAKHNDPESIDDKILDKIHETSTILSEWFKNANVGDFKRGKDDDGDAEGGERLPVAEEMFVKQETTAVERGIIIEEGEDEFKEALEEVLMDTAEEGASGATAGDAEGAGGVIAAEEEAPTGAEEVPSGEEAGIVGAEGGTAEEVPSLEEAGIVGTEGGTAGAEGATALSDTVVAETEGDQDREQVAAEGVEGAHDAKDTESVKDDKVEDKAGALVDDVLEESQEQGPVQEEITSTPTDEEANAGAVTETQIEEPKPQEDSEALEDIRGDAGLIDVKEDMSTPVRETPAVTALGDFIEGAPMGPPVAPEKDESEVSKFADELQRLDSLLGVIRGHKTSKVFEHEPETICCLSLKIWAVWLLEIANNAHNWTMWIADIIKRVRYYAAVIRGDILLPNGKKKVLYKEEWRQFVRDTEEKVVAWRQYSNHVKELSNEIMTSFHGKTVTCCQKCLQDHLIKNVVTAHETLLALTEAINCAGYWQRCLDKIVEQTSKITKLDVAGDKAEVASVTSEESYIIEIEEIPHLPMIPVLSEDSVYEIEELAVIRRPQPQTYELEALTPVSIKPPILKRQSLKQEAAGAAAPSAATIPKKIKAKKR